MINLEEIRCWYWLHNTNGNIGRVIAIYPFIEGDPEVIMEYHEGNTCFSDAKMLNPIEITPFILEKNGLELKEGIYVLKSNPRLGWYPKEKQLIVHYCTFPAKIEFVHQLQNIMIDFGIKDKITL